MGWAPNMTGEDGYVRHTGRTLCDDQDRPGVMSRSDQEVGKDSSPDSERVRSRPHLSDFWPPELRQDKCLC